MSDEMCASCPFRSSAERDDLTRLTQRAPQEFWPCHEAAEFDYLTDTECKGHQTAKELNQ